MRENVGRTDQKMRAVMGPLLLGAGYAWLGGKEGRMGGLLTMVAGAMVTETAITRTCPINELLGVDTTQEAEEPLALGPSTPALGQESAGAYVSPRAERGKGLTAEALAAEAGGEEPAGARVGAIDYSNFLNAAASLSFIGDEETAESAVKAVLGILASRLEETEAKRLIARLPDPLSYENLRGHQMHVTDLSVDQYYGNLAKQFHLTPDQAQVLAVTILRLVKESLDTEGLLDVERSLPEEWSDLIERV